MKNYLLCSFILCVSTFSRGSELKQGQKQVLKQVVNNYLAIPYSNHKIIKNYKMYKRIFSKKLCSAGTEETFWNIYKNYKNQGYYLPILPDKTLDSKTIKKYLPVIKKKSKWIESQAKKALELPESFFEKSHLELRDLEKQLARLVSFKARFTATLSDTKRKKTIQNSKKLFLKFKDQLKYFFNKQSYLLSYKYPINHLQLRTNYDKYKQRQDIKGKRIANDVYFYRQIVQDGTLSENGIGGDRSVRAVIDTINLYFNESESSFITENMRFDLEYLFKKMNKNLKYGSKKLNKIMTNWKKRNQKKEQFYEDLLNNDLETKERVKSILLKKGTARLALKDYVLKKEAETFLFWHEKEEVYRALFAIETILFGEVGGFEGRSRSERKDIVRVILNRSRMKEYSEILPENMITPYLDKVFPKKNYLLHKWLSLLLKEGEFSFSYYFLSGNLRIYCPSGTRRAKFLENTNIMIALKEMRNFNGKFKGVRYFSRASMHGRIDMSSLWSRFSAIPERIGTKVIYKRRLKKLFNKGQFRDLYSFKSTDGLPYRVIEIKKKNYVIPYGKIEFYHHRNPHYFRYFIEN